MCNNFGVGSAAELGINKCQLLWNLGHMKSTNHMYEISSHQLKTGNNCGNLIKFLTCIKIKI